MNGDTNISGDARRDLSEELVAYLDGELPPAGMRQVEERLAGDAEAQHELQLLDRSWQLLDSLPAAPVADRFAQTTVEMVALTAQREHQARVRWAPWRRMAGWGFGALALLLCGAMGYAAVSRQQGDENERLLADLPVLENLDAYRQVGDIEFARLLVALPADAFVDDDGDPSTPDADDDASAVVLAPVAAAETPAQRRARVEAMPTAQKQALLRRFERFAGLDAGAQQALRKLQSDIAADPQAASLQAAIDRYYAWAQTLPSIDRAQLRELPAAARKIEVERRLAANDQRRDRNRDEANRPSRENIAALSAWFREDVLPDLRAKLWESIPAEKKAELEKLDPQQRERALWGESFRAMRHRSGQPQPSFTETQLAALEARLVSPAKEQFQAAATLEAKQALVQGWLGAMRDQFGWGNPQRQHGFDARHRELMRFLNEEVSPQERKELEALPRDQFWHRLGELYAEDRFIRGEPMPEFPRHGDGDRRPRPGGQHGAGKGPPPPRPGPDA